MNSQWEVFKEFGMLPDTVCVEWIVVIIIIYKNTYCYFTFLNNTADHKATKPRDMKTNLDQPKKNIIKPVNLLEKKILQCLLKQVL